MTDVSTLPIILDCDPGQDDAISLMMALAPGTPLDIRAVTVVAGNTILDKVQRNARMIVQLCERADIPIYAGCEHPLKVHLATAEEVHGTEGLDGIEIFEPHIPLQSEHAVDAIIRICRENAKVVIVPTGPLTNIATALTRAPDIAEHIVEIVLMGGARREGGNITPSAEFNIFVDPHAAAQVFESDIPKTVFGLDVTHQVLCTPDHVAEIGRIHNPIAELAVPMLSGRYAEFDQEKYETQGTPLHDPCTVAYLLQPDLFQFREVNIRVEADSEISRGHTAVDFWHGTDLPRTSRWAHGVDAPGFFELMLAQIRRYG